MKTVIFLICGMLALTAAHAGESWYEPTPTEQRLDFGYKPTDFQTTFWELMPGRLAPLNTKTAVGVPGWPVIGYGYLMRTRYSEFDMKMTVQTPEGERFPHTRPNFRQHSPGDWLPGAISEWDDNGVHYKVTYVCVQNDPQPVDVYQIVMENISGAQTKANLLATLDGAPTLKAEGDLISDRGKPLIVMDPPVPVERITRAAGVVDLRSTASGTWRHPSPAIDEWRTCRAGWYGMPVEYLLKVGQDESLQVFLGFNNEPLISDAIWDLPDNVKEPDTIAAYKDPGQEIVASVEGDTDGRKARTGAGSERQVLKFVGKDTDGDGCIKVSVRVTPESKGPAVLAIIWAFDVGTQVTSDELLKGRQFTPAVRTSNEMYKSQSGGGNSAAQKARYVIDCGEDLPWDISSEWVHIGKDPTAFALQLHYNPTLAPNEEKAYYLKMPAIDKPEVAPYGCAWRPWDTRDTWMPHLAPRHPENNTPYGFDVPHGTDPADYAIYGPKSRGIWRKQLAAARDMNWDEATKKLSDYWQGFTSKSAKFITAEPYLEKLYKHQLADISMHRIPFGDTGHDLQMVGPDWYWDYTIARDNAYLHQAWDLMGYPEIAQDLWEVCLIPKSKLPKSRWTLGQWEGDPGHDGMWLVRQAQWSGQGQVIYGLVNHYLWTGDVEWLKKKYSNIRRGADWTVRAIEGEKKAIGDPSKMGYGMLPPCGPEDGGPGHNYYSNSYNVLGLESAASAADVLGKKDDAERWRKQAGELKIAIERHLRLGYFRLNDFAGVMGISPEWFPGPEYREQRDGKEACKLPPEKMVDTSYGCPLVYPTRAVAPFDPMMNGWFRYREHLAETTAGLYGVYGPSVASDQGLSYIFRGEPDKAVDQFYTYANHASGCLDFGEGVDLDSVFSEFDPPKHGIRTGGQMPHGFSAALFLHYFRRLMVLEDGNDLRLAPAIPRKWLGQPKPIGVENAPTYFGPVTYHLVADPDRVTIRGDVKLDAKRKPARLLVHVRAPGGRGLASVKINGKEWKSYFGDTIVIPDPPSEIKIEAKYIQ